MSCNVPAVFELDGFQDSALGKGDDAIVGDFWVLGKADML